MLDDVAPREWAGRGVQLNVYCWYGQVTAHARYGEVQSRRCYIRYPVQLERRFMRNHGIFAERGRGDDQRLVPARGEVGDTVDAMT